MKDRKIKFRYFTIMEWEKEQDFLRQEGLKGWRFTKATLLGIYHFEKCEPEDVVYQLDYNPDGIAHKEQYVQMFQDCGWEYIQDYFGYSYFRKPASEMAGDEEIFCDDESRLEMVKRIFLSRMVPLIAIFFLLIIPNLYTQSTNHSLAGYALNWGFWILFILYLFLFLVLCRQFWKYWKKLSR